MRKKILIIAIAIPALILLTSVTLTCIKKYCDKADATRLYTEGLKPIDNKDNPFYPKAALAFFDSLLKIPHSPYQTEKIRLARSQVLLKMGREKESAEVLEDLIKTGPDKSQGMITAINENLAITYLRIGERNNCVSNHTAASCIFPIQGKGIYTDPYATQKAIQIYEDMLQNDTSDMVSRWLLNIAYMTIGEYPVKVPQRWLIPGLDTDTSSVKVNAFRNMAGDLQLNGPRETAGGSIVDDFNNDGYLDIVTSSWSLNDGMHYYKNNSDGTFTDLSQASGLSAIKGGLNIIQADYNNDGYLDILVLRGAWLGEFGKQPNSLLRNNGDGTFTDVTIESGLLSFHPTQTATWADFNNDGWLDLFIGNETSDYDHPHPSELYINNQDGTFTNVAKESGTEYTCFMKGVVSADYNNDGWPDIFISDLNGRKMILKNKGIKGTIPQFENATHEAGLDKNVVRTFPAWFWDYDNDGWPDIFVCGYQFPSSLTASVAAEALNRPLSNASKMYLYHNNHDGTFTNVSMAAGLDHAVFAMGSNFGDMDNDGWLDMYLGTGNPDFKSLVPNKMYKNIDGQKFVDVTSSARVGNLQKGHGVSFADVDNDGDQDIYIKVGGAVPGDAFYNSFYVNPGQNKNNWISVLLEGTKSNRSAIGAHIAVTFTEESKKRTVFMDVNSGGSFGSNPLRKEIGIGKAKLIDELIIKWPTSGIVQVFKNISPCQFIKIKEGNEEIEKMNLKVLNFKTQMADMKMVSCSPMK
ncbi:MAG TPA: CRTAC1 family protein [Puia sp.]|nr:CRTAC1 family protein [Puia sp.]